MGVSARTAKQRMKMSRAESRMGMTCAIIVASASASRTGKERTSSESIVATRRATIDPSLSFNETLSKARQRTKPVNASIRGLVAKT
jgi:hypothetical protein